MHSPNRIDLDDPAEAMLWADNLSISVERLREIVARVGPMVAAVTFYAKKSGADGDRGGAAIRGTPDPRQNPTAGPVTPPTVFPSMTT